LAVAKVLGLSLPTEWQPTSELPGRAHAKTAGGVTLWDETYNANPDSMRAAIKSLFLQPGRKILVLGEMGELGSEEVEEHQALGRFLADYPVHLLVTVGPLAARYGEGSRCPHQNFDTREAAAEALIPVLAAGDAVLFKGSRSTRMEEILEKTHRALEGTKGV
ncbi:MAG: glutamate ligase domain-containing protein, partial [Bacteroidota bacterium]